MGFWVGRCHSLMVLSLLAEAKVLPSGLKATLQTEFLCPVRVAMDFWGCRFHSLMVLSKLAEANVKPSGLKATLLTELLCPSKLLRSFTADTACCSAAITRPLICFVVSAEASSCLNALPAFNASNSAWNVCPERNDSLEKAVSWMTFAKF